MLTVNRSGIINAINVTCDLWIPSQKTYIGE